MIRSRCWREQCGRSSAKASAPYAAAPRDSPRARGHYAPNPRRIFISGQKRGVFGRMKRELRRRSAMRELWSKNLVQLDRLTALEREAARLDGEGGQLIAAAAQAKGKVAETALQILQID